VNGLLGSAALLVAFSASPGASSQSADASQEIRALMLDVQDIRALGFLNPIKLTKNQIGKLIAIISTAQQRYNTILATASAIPVQQIAKEIRETKKAMIAGCQIPPEFEAKVKRIQERWVQRRDKEDLNTLKTLSASVKSILTKNQFAKAAILARKLEPKAKSGAKVDGDDKLFNLYVLKIIIQNPRIVPLLTEMQQSREVPANPKSAFFYLIPTTDRGGIVQSTFVLKSTSR